MEGLLKYLTLTLVVALGLAVSVNARIDPECPPPGSNDTAYLPHESNCSLYYICDNGFKVLMKCPDGLHWNTELKVCDQPWSAGCELKIRAPTCPIVTDPEDPPIYHPHENDCARYYVCDNGVAVELECPDGLHWNNKLKVCDYPWSAGCQSKIRAPTCPIVTDPEDPPIYHPHESDCARYYVCDNGVAVELECPDGLHWNNKLKVCDYPWSAGCQSKIRAPTCPIVTDPEDPPIYHPHESDCARYYVCDNGMAIQLECPDGLHWNNKLKVCDYPWSAGCKSKVQKPKHSVPKAPVVVIEVPKVPLVLRVPNCPIQTNPEDPAIYFPHETDCSKYYECANGVAVVMDCPDGLHWNDKIKVCDFPAVAGCKTGN